MILTTNYEFYFPILSGSIFFIFHQLSLHLNKIKVMKKIETRKIFQGTKNFFFKGNIY